MLSFIVGVLGLGAFFAGLGLVVYGAWLLLRKYGWVIAPYLVNDPKDPNKFYCFTAVEQGELKVVVRGKQVVGYIMNMPEKSLRRENDPPKNPPTNSKQKLTVNNAEYADVIPEPADTETEDLLYWWEGSRWEGVVKHIYERQKLVFVGIPPWQKLVHRPFRSAHLVEDEKTGKKTISYKDGTTDHMRVREFARPFFARSVETKEGLKVTLGVEITFETINGFRQWFGIDRFELRLDNIVPARMQEFVKRTSIDTVLTAEEATARAIEDYLIGDGDSGVLKDALFGYGLRAKKAHIFEIEPELSSDDQAALTAIWREGRLAKAREEKAKGDRKYLEETSAPLKDNPALADIERIRAAASGKGVTTVIERSGGQSNPTDHALLAELQRQRGGKGGKS